MALYEYPEIPRKFNDIEEPTCLKCILEPYRFGDKDRVREEIRQIYTRRIRTGDCQKHGPGQDFIMPLPKAN